MTQLDLIKSRIKKLYDTSPDIHINICIARSKDSLKNEPAVIKGVYPHIFQIEEYSSGSPKCHTFQYTDLFTKQIEIAELM